MAVSSIAPALDSRLDLMHRLGRAMADPTRSRILLALLDEPAYPADLADTLGLTRQNVSNHLACLRDCGIVAAEPHGRQVRYSIRPASRRFARTAADRGARGRGDGRLSR